jgi:hypothetical protein
MGIQYRIIIRPAGMKYNEFIIKAFERKPGKWRASVHRTDGKPVWPGRGRRKLETFVTGIDSKSEQAAMLLALGAVDAGAFHKE